MTDIEKLYYEVERIIKGNEKYRNVFKIKIQKATAVKYHEESWYDVSFNIYAGTALAYHDSFRRNGDGIKIDIDDEVSKMEEILETEFINYEKAERVKELMEMTSSDEE